MSKVSIPGKLIGDGLSMQECFEHILENPGTYYFKYHNGVRFINFCCPCGCRMFNSLPVHTNESSVLGWKMSGDDDAPTLAPSIGMKPNKDSQDVEMDGYHWHGHLLNGVWTSALK